MKLSEDVAQILQYGRVVRNSFYLPDGQLDRKLYASVNKALEMLGGRWDRKSKSHVFDSDPAKILQDALLTEKVIDSKKELQYFPTPSIVVDQMIVAANLKSSDCVLEPSAGQGAIIKQIIERVNCEITAVEIDKKNALQCGKYCNVRIQDFLTCSVEDLGLFDKIIMNPPFSKQQDITHVTHAYSMLKPGGMLVAVMSEGTFFRSTNKAKEFHKLIDLTCVSQADLPSGTFKESGTQVRTRMIVLEKPINASLT